MFKALCAINVHLHLHHSTHCTTDTIFTFYFNSHRHFDIVPPSPLTPTRHFPFPSARAGACLLLLPPPFAPSLSPPSLPRLCLLASCRRSRLPCRRLVCAAFVSSSPLPAVAVARSSSPLGPFPLCPPLGCVWFGRPRRLAWAWGPPPPTRPCLYGIALAGRADSFPARDQRRECRSDRLQLEPGTFTASSGSGSIFMLESGGPLYS